MTTLRCDLLALACCVAAPAFAQPAADPGQAAYDEGRKLYDRHEWTAAIARFQESYRLRHDAPSLFDIAQAYRLSGDCVQAVAFYRQYEHDFPQATNLAKVDKFITDLAACAKEHEVKVEPPKPPPEAPKPPPPPPPPKPAPVAEGGHGTRLAGLALAGGGVAAIATGFVFGHLASADADQADKGHGTWDPSVERAGKRDDVIAKVLWGVGGAAIVGGAVTYVVDGRGAETPQVSIGLSRGGASLVWQCGF